MLPGNLSLTTEYYGMSSSKNKDQTTHFEMVCKLFLTIQSTVEC